MCEWGPSKQSSPAIRRYPVEEHRLILVVSGESETGSMAGAPARLTPERLAEVEAAFNDFDSDGDGRISLDEAHVVLESVLGFSKDASRRLVRVCDTNRDGSLSFDEFVDFYFRIKHKIREMKALFMEFDTDHNGFIEMHEAKQALRMMSLKDEEIEQLVMAYDENCDGRLQYEEFIKLWNAS